MDTTDLDTIPQEMKSNFPTGVSEAKFDTAKEMQAFLTGLSWADDCDVTTGSVFERDGKHVVRVRVGDF